MDNKRGEFQYRIFISYSHKDKDRAEKLAKTLKENGLNPIYDKHFEGGFGFTDQIKKFIAHAHVFVPLITKSSSQRGWVHQEIGYAAALNVPIMPIMIDRFWWLCSSRFKLYIGTMTKKTSRKLCPLKGLRTLSKTLKTACLKISLPSLSVAYCAMTQPS